MRATFVHARTDWGLTPWWLVTLWSSLTDWGLTLLLPRRRRRRRPPYFLWAQRPVSRGLLPQSSRSTRSAGRGTPRSSSRRRVRTECRRTEALRRTPRRTRGAGSARDQSDRRPGCSGTDLDHDQRNIHQCRRRKRTHILKLWLHVNQKTFRNTFVVLATNHFSIKYAY